jgi:hypothetical protein
MIHSECNGSRANLLIRVSIFESQFWPTVTFQKKILYVFTDSQDHLLHSSSQEKIFETNQKSHFKYKRYDT